MFFTLALPACMFFSILSDFFDVSKISFALKGTGHPVHPQPNLPEHFGGGDREECRQAGKNSCNIFLCYETTGLRIVNKKKNYNKEAIIWYDIKIVRLEKYLPATFQASHVSDQSMVTKCSCYKKR